MGVPAPLLVSIGRPYSPCYVTYARFLQREGPSSPDTNGLHLLYFETWPKRPYHGDTSGSL